MRLIKMLGLAAVLAVVGMAFVASSAMATGETVLCEENVLVCPASKKIVHTAINLIAEDSVAHPLLLNTSLIDMLCLAVHVKLRVLLLANPLVGHGEAFQWLNCSTDGSAAHSNCTLKTLTLGTVLILKFGSNQGTVQFHGFEFLAECIGLHCIYGGLLSLPFKGGTTLAAGAKAIIEANNVVLTAVGGFFCPAKSEWQALYFITSPVHTYISL